MAPQFRSAGARRARNEFAALKGVGAACVALLGYAALVFPAVGPSHGELPAAFAVTPLAKLSRSGEDLIITGSVGHMFESAAFSGPNRLGKQDRLRPVVDVLAHVGGFTALRARLAALRNPPPPVPQAVPVRVAAIDPAKTLDPSASEALGAIDDAAPSLVIPKRRPDSQVAYAPSSGGLDGIAADTPVKAKDGKKWSQKEMQCLATAIYFEARGEAYRGQVAVAQVVMNRVKHRLYPSTICGVVFQNQSKRNACQFSFACDGIPERINEPKPWKQAQEIAKGVVDGNLYLTEVGFATHYHATYVYPHWAPRMKKLTKVGLHVFYQFKRGWKFG